VDPTSARLPIGEDGGGSNRLLFRKGTADKNNAPIPTRTAVFREAVKNRKAGPTADSSGTASGCRRKAFRSSAVAHGSI